MPSNISFLPPKGTPEAERLIRFYSNCSDEDINALFLKYGYKNRHSFMASMNTIYGMKRSRVVTHPEPISPSSDLTDLESNVLRLVQHSAISVGEISRQVDRSSETIIKTIDSLRAKHYDVVLDEHRHQVSVPQVPDKTFEATAFEYFRHFYRVGIVSDTHICSKYQQMTLLYDAYKEFDEKKVDFILHGGDVGDGQNMYRGHENEVFRHGAREHRDYIVENYPTSARNTNTYIIGGQHDFCWYKQNGYNMLEEICERRQDLIFRGFFDAKFKIKDLEIGLNHPGGGVSYARSYRIQKYIENMIGFITSIPLAITPVLQLFGHWHIPCHLPMYMGVDAVSLPCFQSQTPYLTEKGLMPVVGYAIAEIRLDDAYNMTGVRIEFINLNAHIIENDY